LKEEFPYIFSNMSESHGEIHPKGGRFVIPWFSEKIKIC
jgi:hypothetical protein